MAREWEAGAPPQAHRRARFLPPPPPPPPFQPGGPTAGVCGSRGSRGSLLRRRWWRRRQWGAGAGINPMSPAPGVGVPGCEAGGGTAGGPGQETGGHRPWRPTQTLGDATADGGAADDGGGTNASQAVAPVGVRCSKGGAPPRPSPPLADDPLGLHGTRWRRPLGDEPVGGIASNLSRWAGLRQTCLWRCSRRGPRCAGCHPPSRATPATRRLRGVTHRGWGEAGRQAGAGGVRGQGRAWEWGGRCSCRDRKEGGASVYGAPVGAAVKAGRPSLDCQAVNAVGASASAGGRGRVHQCGGRGSTR